MRKPRNRCSDCELWAPGDYWEITHNPRFSVFAPGTCKGTGKPKANCEHACPHFKKALRGIIYQHRTK